MALPILIAKNQTVFGIFLQTYVIKHPGMKVLPK